MIKDSLKIKILGIYLLLILISFVLIAIMGYFYLPAKSLLSSLTIISCSGGIGGTIYSIRGFYQSLAEGIFNFDNWVWWYIFRPIISAIVGVFVSFFIIGGILNIGSFGLNYARGLMFFCGIAFLTGFSFTHFADKLEEFARAIFIKKERKK